MTRNKNKRGRALGGLAVIVLLVTVVVAQDKVRDDKPKYRGTIGADSKKIKKDGDKVLLWAKGDPESAESEWYDFTGAPLKPAKLQFGIGRDRIPAIDDPLFVSPDDPRLLKMIPDSPYRPEARPESSDDIWVIGYVEGGEARAYPIALLDHHELVNDTIAGKPVTVAW